MKTLFKCEGCSRIYEREKDARQCESSKKCQKLLRLKK